MATNKETIVKPSKSKTLVRTLIDAAGAAPKDAWMNIDELREHQGKTAVPARDGLGPESC